jgi:SAM-dependent methyltransferase
MLERFKQWLRGDYNSVRYRFGTLPLAWLNYGFAYALLGKGWTEFYADRLNKNVRLNEDAPLNEAYKKGGLLHLNFMKAQGLNPSDTLLDYGCGVMRSGVFFAKYLERGKYTGADISRERLRRAVKFMHEEGISERSFRAILVSNCNLRELSGMKFDYVFANSVLTHMSKKNIIDMLAAMRPILSDGGKFYFTYSEAERNKRRNLKDFWYSRNEMRGMCERAGYEFQVVDGWNASDDVMALALLRSESGFARQQAGGKVIG